LRPAINTTQTHNLHSPAGFSVLQLWLVPVLLSILLLLLLLLLFNTKWRVHSLLSLLLIPDLLVEVCEVDVWAA
jgi:hypothetical protein